MANIGSLWIKKSKDGVVYMSGVLNGIDKDINIAVFKNKEKQSDKSPDYRIVRSEEKKEEVKKELTPEQEEQGINIEDIPF